MHSCLRDNFFRKLLFGTFVVVDEVQRGRKGSMRETTIETLKFTEIGNEINLEIYQQKNH